MNKSTLNINDSNIYQSISNRYQLSKQLEPTLNTIYSRLSSSYNSKSNTNILLSNNNQLPYNNTLLENKEQYNSIIYVTSIRDTNRLEELPALTGGTEQHGIDILNDDYAQISLLFPNVNSILIPKKAEYNLKRYVPKELLRKINPDIEIAIEKCLVFLSNLASTYYTDNKYKSLHSKILHEQLKYDKDNTYIYTLVIKALKVGTAKDGAIIKVKKGDDDTESYVIGKSSKQYRLTDTYLKAGLTEHTIKDEAIVQNRNRLFYKALFEANENVITRNLVTLYQHIELPTKAEILKEGKRLVKAGYITKSQKKLTMRYRHKNDYWKDTKKRSFIEDNIELYSFLTNRGFMIPTAGKHTNGGRVVDSFTLMPSWIRNMVKINGEPIIESDYSAMHPNLANSLYHGSGKHISHLMVADYLGITRGEAKKEHLSFFNKPYYPLKTKKEAKKGSMVASPVIKYYEDNEPIMLANIRKDKIDNEYKSTTYKLFGLEVEVMTEVISRLNDIDIYVMYVYDALYCTDNQYNTVAYTMNQVVQEMSINTMVG